MSKRLVLALAALALTLNACASKSGVTQSDPALSPAPTVAEIPFPATQPPAPGPAVTSDSSVTVNAPVGCQTFTLPSAPTAETPSRFPAALPGDWTRGPDNAPVTIIEYSEFQCASCAAFATQLALLQIANPDQIRIIFRHFPLIGFPDQPIHDKAALSAQAAEAAGRQGKFWEMHDILFAEQGTWSEFSLEEFETWAVQQAASLDLDTGQFKTDMTSPELVQFAADAWTQGVAYNLGKTPSLVINGQLMDTIPLTFSTMDNLVKLMLLEKRQYPTCPPITIDQSTRYVATLHTSKGDIMLELFADLAPLAVNNFVFLAREGWYDQVTFHRVMPDLMAQAGDPTGTGWGGPGYTFIDEIVEGLGFDRAGLLAMVNAGPDTNGSQFFITYGPAPHLNGAYTIFGQVINGMDVLARLTPRNPDAGMNLPPGDLILSVDIEEK